MAQKTCFFSLFNITNVYYAVIIPVLPLANKIYRAVKHSH